MGIVKVIVKCLLFYFLKKLKFLLLVGNNNILFHIAAKCESKKVSQLLFEKVEITTLFW